jgi:hypothetical protein
MDLECGEITHEAALVGLSGYLVVSPCGHWHQVMFWQTTSSITFGPNPK